MTPHGDRGPVQRQRAEVRELAAEYQRLAVQLAIVEAAHGVVCQDVRAELDDLGRRLRGLLARVAWELPPQVH